jgi:imidazolonepropionase-like amidohydrolase
VNFVRSIFAWLLIVLLPASFVAQTGPVSSTESLAFTHVTVIDMTGAAPKPDMTLVVIGNRIAAVAKTGKVPIPKNARVIDATGKYLIPGLWDMHAHVFHYRLPLPPDEYDFPLFIANGVTGVREMWTRVDKMDQIRLWRKQFYEHPGTIPRFAAVGTLVDGPPATWTNSDIVSSADEARLMVDKVKAGGVDFFKVYNRLSREAYFAIADEAKSQHIPFAGHVPLAITLREASDAGQRSVEHLTGFLTVFGPGCPPALIERLAKEDLPKAIAAGAPERRMLEQVLELCDEKKAFALFRHLAENGTWQVPTLVLRKIDATDSDTLYGDDRLKYMPGGKDHFSDWDEFHSRRQKRTAKDWDDERDRLKRALEIVGTMHRAGVRFMAGTDVSNPYLYPGFSLHDELALFVAAGFTPMEALETATRNPAVFLGLLDSLGTIEKGKFADLVLLEANPLNDISNTRRVNAVVVNGRYLSKEMLQKMLTDAETRANGRAMSNKTLDESRSSLVNSAQ